MQAGYEKITIFDHLTLYRKSCKTEP